MTGKEYSDLIASYLIKNYGDRNLKVYREVTLGKTIIGKNRRLDVFTIHEPTNRAFAIECKYQDSQGTVDEKIPYTINDMESLRIPGCIAYAGTGFSEGILHMLESSHLAAYCFPDKENLRPSEKTREFDHILAMTFEWWDVVLVGKKAFDLPS